MEFQISICFDRAQMEYLRRASERERRSVAFIVRELVDAALEREAQLERATA